MPHGVSPAYRWLSFFPAPLGRVAYAAVLRCALPVLRHRCVYPACTLQLEKIIMKAIRSCSQTPSRRCKHGRNVRRIGCWLTAITSSCCLAGAKNHAVAGDLPLPRIVVNNGNFQNVDSGEVFTPRGFSYIRLNADGWHNTFEPGAYDSARAESMLADLASSGFNTTRVFIDETIGPGSVASFEATELSPAYMANVFDFLGRARGHEIYVVPRFPGGSPVTNMRPFVIQHHQRSLARLRM